MKIKNIIGFSLLIATAGFAQELPTIDISPISYLDSIKNTFVKHDMAACVDERWIKEMTNQELFQEMSLDIASINLEEEVVYDLSTALLKERLQILDSKSAFDIEYNPGLENIIKYYLKNRKKSFERLMALSDYYFPIFEEALAKYNVPLEIKYLAIVESALNPKAVSRMGATGLWQFMYGTGKQYNLEISTFIDERSDLLKSTEAACQYMQNMYKIFGDWDLVLASYNAGPGNVTKAIRRSGGKQNYWNIRPYLPKETQGYVPAFLATMYVYEFHKEHGITPQKPVMNVYETDTIHLKSKISFKQLSDLLDISLEELQFLNPSYKRNLIPYIDGKVCYVRLPIEKVAVFTSNEDKIYAYLAYDFGQKETPLESMAQHYEVNYLTHKIKNGESLGSIAKKYRVTVNDLKRWNNIKGNTIVAGKTLKIQTTQTLTAAPKKNIPKPEVQTTTTVERNVTESFASTSAVEVESPSKRKNTSEEMYYVVKKGDSLYSISKKIPGVSVSDLQKWNGISGGAIKPGMKLKISG
jgi:membrane-bound lytic murein transglycosylase D